MGIPAFYKWLTERYPKTVVPAVEETPLVINGVTVPIRTFDPNPNGIEFDNLYLDMNGIIHPCFHPEGLLAPSSYEEVFLGVFKYIDRIFSIVRPRKLLFMAIDGVAPRAKMNQQRSRRFRAAKAAADEAILAEWLRVAVESEGGMQDPVEKPKKLDSNVITPGTEFMDLLSSALHYYIHLRLNKDLGWRGIKVILSDATVPGEGEHKIMSYIRLQRNLPGFDPNTHHCLYGLDADLIMLALATHEVHFTILREDVRQANQSMEKFSAKKRKRKHGRNSLQKQKASVNLETYILGLRFQLLNIWVLREYLALDMRVPSSTIEIDLERLTDDFVFICLFIGNDFLPHIPSLEISEGAIDLLMTIYKTEFVKMGGYLTSSSEINFSRVEHFVQAVGSHESAIFRKRLQIRKQQKAWIRTLSMHQRVGHFSKLPLKDQSIQSGSHALSSQPEVVSLNQAQQDINSDCDKIRLGEEGWKERYYKEKFEAKTKDEQERTRGNAVLKYIEGISWVMQYYYVGVCSWQWFYPYHYAPFASDFCGIGQLEFDFFLGKPFKPFDQLMGVLPAARKLMTDVSSPILDFYPTDFELDMNGKRFSWQAICKLPFIEESRLLSEIAKVEHTLSDEERRRNSLGSDSLFVHLSHPLAKMIIAFFEDVQENLLEAKAQKQIDPEVSGGMNGYICLTNTSTVQPLEVYSPINGMQMVLQSQVITVLYKYPPFHPHITRIPEGVILPGKIVSKQEMPSQPRIWHEITNFRHISLRRPIRNAISGLRLAKCARLLISKIIPPKLQAHRGPGLHISEILEGEETKPTAENTLRGYNNNSIRGRCEGRNVHDDAVPNNVKKLEDFNHGDFEGSHALNGNEKAIKSETRTKKMRKRKWKEDISMTNNNVLESEMSVEHIGIDKHVTAGALHANAVLKSEESQGDGIDGSNLENSYTSRLVEGLKSQNLEVQKAGDQSVEIKIKIKAKKKRSGKRKLVEASGFLTDNNGKLESSTPGEQRSDVVAHVSLDGVENLKGRFLEVQKAGHGVPMLSGQTLAEIAGTKSEGSLSDCIDGSNLDTYHNLKSQILEVDKAGDQSVDIKLEVKAKKKRRSKKRELVEASGILIDNTVNLESSASGEQRSDVAHIALDGVEGLKSCILGVQKVGHDAPMLYGQTLAEIGEQKSSKKRSSKKRRPIETNNIGIRSPSFESLVNGELRRGDVVRAALPGLESFKSILEPQESGNDIPSVLDQPVELMTELEANKKRRAKKKKKDAANNIDTTGTPGSCAFGTQGRDDVTGTALDGMQSLKSCTLEAQKAGDDASIVSNQQEEANPRGKAKKKRPPKKKTKVQADTVAIADINFESSAFQDGVHSLKSCTLEAQKAGDDASIVSNQQEEAIPGGKAKKKRRPRKNSEVLADAVAIADIKNFDNLVHREEWVGDVAHVALDGPIPMDGFQRLESSVFEELKEDENVPICANGISKSKSKKRKAEKRRMNKVENVTSVSPEKLEPFHSIARESGDGGAIDGLEETSSEIKSKKRKRRSKKAGENLESVNEN